MSSEGGDPRLLELIQRTPTGVVRTALPVQGLLVIGSGPEAQLRLSDPGLLPRHAAIAPVRGGGFGIKALSERAQIELNGKPVRAARIKLGDRLSLGSLELELGLSPEPASAPVPRAVPSGDPLPRIPGYQLERLVGRGALAKVYLAVQENLNRQVALKVLEPRLAADAGFVERFQQEARAAAALHHAHMVTVFDVGAGGGFNYLALEYMDRGSLEDRLNSEGPLPWRAALSVLDGAARGLEFARSKGLVHRDIKPANLMQNAAGQTKIADLGLAASEAEAGAEATPRSAEGGRRIVGTPHFMAPEQIRSEAVDHRADLYALGASAYRLISGQNPYEGADPREILRAKLAGPHRPLVERVPDLPKGVLALIERLLAREPEQRPQSAAEVSAEIQRLIEGSGSGAAGGKRRPFALAGLGLLLAAGGWYALQGAGVDPRSEPNPTPRIQAGPSPADSELEGSLGASDREPEPDPDQGEPRAVAPAGAEDQRLIELEQRAKESLARARSTPDAAARALALEELGVAFAGTNAAREAAEELLALASSGQPVEAKPAAEAEGAWAAWLDLYRANGRELRPLEELAKKRATPPPAGVDPAEWQRQVQPLYDQRLTELVAEAERRGTAAAQSLCSGAFGAGRTALEALEVWISEPSSDAPEASPAPGESQLPVAPSVEAFLPAFERAQVLLVDLPSLVERYAAVRLASDREQVADVLHTPGFLEDLDRLDFDAALGRLTEITPFDGQRLAESLATALARLQAVLAQARGAPVLLETSFAAGDWRRKTVRLPGDRRGGAEVIAIRAGELVTVVGGAEERFPLRDYADDPTLLGELFESRLSRDWSPEERVQIAAWQGLQATLLAARRLGPALDSKVPVGISRLDLLTGGFDQAQKGLEGLEFTAGAEQLQADRLTFDLAVRASEAAAASDWTSAAYALESLFVLSPEGPLLWLLSSGLRTGSPPSWPPEGLGAFP